MSNLRSVPVLHQQDGGLSLQAFAQREGLTLGEVKGCIKRGKVLGARKDARSKHWWIYPPAKLLERPRSRAKSQEVFPEVGAELPGLLPCGSAVAVEAGAKSGQPGQHAPQVKAEGIFPPAKLVLPLLFDASAPLVYRSPAVQSSLRAIREAAARQHREGIHYLRLNGGEFAQLYAALGRERSRIRKLVSRGLAAIGELRVSDSAWHKLQAMCQQGRLL